MLVNIQDELSSSDTAHIIIHDDHSDIWDGFFPSLADHFRSQNIKLDYIISRENYGKRNYWRVINKLYHHLAEISSDTKFDYIFQLPEDVSLTNNFFMKSISLMRSVDSICMNLLADQRKGTQQWTSFKGEKLAWSDLWSSGWIDMCYCAVPAFFEIINFTINPVPDSWFSAPSRSSGVGMQISNRIIASGHHFHQVDKSLVVHGGYNSVMHPDLRKLEPLKEVTTNHSSRHIVASLASIPSRVDSLRSVVDVILPQVDELYVFLNDYDDIPDFLDANGVHVYRSQSYADLGDVGKFFASLFLDKNTYHLTIDDDIVYPDDYVRTMCDNVDLFDRNAIVTMHGRVFLETPVSSYYRARVDSFRCSNDHSRNKYLHIPGTGVMAYHTSLVQFDISDFSHINMSDIYVGVKAQRLCIPIVGVAHKAMMSFKTDPACSIYSQCRRDDSIQTQIVNSLKWNLNKL